RYCDDVGFFAQLRSDLPHAIDFSETQRAFERARMSSSQIAGQQVEALRFSGMQGLLALSASESARLAIIQVLGSEPRGGNANTCGTVEREYFMFVAARVHRKVRRLHTRVDTAECFGFDAATSERKSVLSRCMTKRRSRAP